MAKSSARIDQLERARGSWELVVQIDPNDDALLETLRRVLRFPRSDRQRLVEMLPGPVRRGARSDLHVVLEKLHAAGFDAEVRRSSREV